MANEPTFTLDPKNGGMNWGYCQAPSKKGLGALSKYTAIVETSSVPLSETTSGIRVKLYGDLGKSDLASLGDNFERGSTKKVSFTAPDVGKIQQIKLNLEGSQPFRCKKITIKNGAKTFTFQCLRKLEACTSEDPHGPKCNMKLIAEGNVPYEITVKANEAPGSGSSSPVLISVIGKKGQGQWKLLTDKGIRDGGAETKRLMADDVGDIVGFELQIPEPGKLVPAYVRIKNMSKEHY